MTKLALNSLVRPEIIDSGRIRLGAANKPPVVNPAVADSGKIRMGAANKRRSTAG